MKCSHQHMQQFHESFMSCPDLVTVVNCNEWTRNGWDAVVIGAYLRNANKS